MQPQLGRGWYRDPQNPRNERYFDGQQWTKNVRKDIPDIPMAPWRDPNSAPSMGGYAIDVSAPPSMARTWVSLALGVAGVASAFGVGYMVTSHGLDEMLHGLPGIDVREAPPGDAHVEYVTCDLIPQEMLYLNEQSPSIELNGQFGEVRTIADHQPITSIPTEDTVAYPVLECEIDAGDARGVLRPVVADLYLTSQGFALNFYEK